jgi:hypothetical protein
MSAIVWQTPDSRLPIQAGGGRVAYHLPTCNAVIFLRDWRCQVDGQGDPEPPVVPRTCAHTIA